MRTPAAVAFVAGALGGAAFGVVLGQGTPMAWAGFAEPATAAATLTADVLQPPSGLTATPGCNGRDHQVELSWTASPTPWVESYEVAGSTTPGGPYMVLAPPAGQDPLATSRTVGGLAPSTTYYATVRSVRGSWDASSAEVVVQTEKNCK